MKESENDLLRRGDVIEYIQSDVQPYTIARVWAIPAVQPAGDAISREALLKSFDAGMFYADTWVRITTAIRNAPSIPAVTLPEPLVKPEDVVEGIKWHDGAMEHYIHKCMPSDAQVGYPGGWDRWFSKKAVAAMLNVAEEVTFPEGHRLAPKPEPTLIELVERYISIVPSGLSQIALREKIKAAIEAEKRKAKE